MRRVLLVWCASLLLAPTASASWREDADVQGLEAAWALAMAAPFEVEDVLTDYRGGRCTRVAARHAIRCPLLVATFTADGDPLVRCNAPVYLTAYRWALRESDCPDSLLSVRRS